MKKGIFALLTVMTLTSCNFLGIRFPKGKATLSISSRAITDDKLVVQDNVKPDSAKEPNRKHTASYLESTSHIEDMEISDVEVTHTLLETGEKSFDLVVSGLGPGKFTVTINKDDTEGEDVTDQFAWLYYKQVPSKPDGTSGENYFLMSNLAGNIDEEEDYEDIAWEKAYKTETIDDVEYKVFRVFYIGEEELDFGLSVTVSQGTRLFGAEVSMLIRLLDFDIEYETVEDPENPGFFKTDMNNLSFSVTSDKYDLRYGDGSESGEVFEEGTVVELSIEDNPSVPYKFITFLYKETEDDTWTIVNNLPIVFPFINKGDRDNPYLGLPSKHLDTSSISIFDIPKEGPEELVYTDNVTLTPSIFVFYSWTGVDYSNLKFFIEHETDIFEIPLELVSTETTSFYSGSYFRLNLMNMNLDDMTFILLMDITNLNGSNAVLQIGEVNMALGELNLITGLRSGTEPDSGYFSGSSSLFK